MHAPEPILKVLFLCTGNSARSILAEALLNQAGVGRFLAFSAGSVPKGAVHPIALEVLVEHGIATGGLRSKSWNEFCGADAPGMDFVFTVCDAAANEVCPIWPGNPATAHWGLADPAAVAGGLTVRRRAFVRAFHIIEHRVALLTALRIESLDPPTLLHRLREIGRAMP